MGKIAGWTLMVAMACGGVAYAAGGKKLDRWDSVMALRPGEEIDVLTGDQAGPDTCLVSTVDAEALTCLREDPGRDVRMVFPRSAVGDVWVFEVDRRWSALTWIKVVLGSAAVGLGVACIVANPLCALPVLVVGMAVVEGPPPGLYPMPPRPPAPPRLRRRLIYEGATP